VPGVRLGSYPHLALVMTEKRKSTIAYRCGWTDGCYGELGCFTGNRRLAQWKTVSDRLDYYRGHRAGREARQRSVSRLQAS
jgi:hypothetical protein